MKGLISSAAKTKQQKRCFIKNRMRIILFLVVYPYLVGFSPDPDSSATIVDLLLGYGSHSYVTYDCAGNVTSKTKYSDVDYGVSVTHKIDAFKFGARAGGYIINAPDQGFSYNSSYFYTSTVSNKTSVFYLNPFIGTDSKYFEMSFGTSLFSDYAYKDSKEMAGRISEFLIGDSNIHPTWTLRIGNNEKFHFTTQYLSSVPLFSGGGIFDTGFGFGSTESRNLTWLGISSGPYQNIGFSFKQNIQLNDKTDILIRGRFGGIEKTFEGGISAGIRFML